MRHVVLQHCNARMNDRAKSSKPRCPCCSVGGFGCRPGRVKLFLSCTSKRRVIAKLCPVTGARWRDAVGS